MRTFTGGAKVAVFLTALLIGIVFGDQRAEAGRVEVSGARGGEAVEGPGGDAAVESPRGTEAVESPSGRAVVRGPDGNVAAGTRVSTLPVNATTVVVGDKTYYMADDVYYQPYYSGAEVTYIVVVPPQQ